MIKKFINSQDRRIEYLTMGQGDPILIIPAYLHPPFAYERLAKLYANKGYQAYIISLPGFYPAGVIDGQWTFDNYSKLIDDFVRQLTFKNICLLGHSMGGAIAILTAEKYANKINKLILFDTIGIKMDRTIWQWIKFGIQSVSPSFLLKYHGYMKLKYLSSYLHILKLIMNLDLADKLPDLRQSTELVWGKGDNLVPAINGQQMCDLIPNAKFEIIDALGHDWPITNPEIYDRKIPKVK